MEIKVAGLDAGTISGTSKENLTHFLNGQLEVVLNLGTQ